VNACPKLAKSGEYHLVNATKAHTSTTKPGVSIRKHKHLLTVEKYSTGVRTSLHRRGSPTVESTAAFVYINN